MPDIQNIHGRKGGRGARPWLLLPKYIAVSLILGGLGAVVCLMAAPAILRLDPQRQTLLGDLCGIIFRYQIIPATIAAILLGTLLFLQHPLVFLRMRWLRLKLALIIVTVPASHDLLRLDVHLQQQSPPSNLRLYASISLAAFMLIALIGRLKPRMAQR